jgi:hypothetical protein
MAHLELGMRRAGEAMHHRQAGDHGRADDAQKRSGREVGQRIEIGDAVISSEALRFVAAAGLVPDPVSVVGGVVERRRPAAGGAGGVGHVPQHPLGRRILARQIGGLQSERLGVGDVVVLAGGRQLLQIVERTDVLRRDAERAEALAIERMRQRDGVQGPPQTPFAHIVGHGGFDAITPPRPPSWRKSFPPA